MESVTLHAASLPRAGNTETGEAAGGGRETRGRIGRGACVSDNVRKRCVRRRGKGG